MTENETNMSIKYAVCVLESIGNGMTLSNENDREEACVLAIQAIDKVQQFEAIGTIEEFKALKEKDEPAKVIEHETPHFVHWQCGNCGAEFYSGQKFCDECGHPADWGDLLK